MANQLTTGKQLIDQLGELNFFDGYTAKARREAEARISKKFEEAMAGDQRKYFERFPASAAACLFVYGEWDYEPFEPLVELHAEATCGMFRPEAVADERDEENETMTLSFTADGRRYSETVEFDGWVPQGFLDLLNTAVRECCNGLEFHPVYNPDSGDSAEFTLCKEKAYKGLVEAGLLCDDPNSVYSGDWE